MKLSTYYNKASIIITIMVLVAGTIIYFLAIDYISREQIDRALSEEIEELVIYVNTHQELPRPQEIHDQQTQFKKTEHKSVNPRFFDTTYFNPQEKILEKGRAIESGISVQGNYYQIVITLSKASTSYLVQIISLITLTLIVGLLFVLFLTNRYILNRLWKPFYNLISQLKNYEVTENTGFKLLKNKVEEFDVLNKALNSMSSKVNNDFYKLKSFTENASHEMMTPLALITSKLDTLIQDETLKPEQYELINDIYGASNKLARLNQSLLLLVKIENNLIEDPVELNLELLISEKIRKFQELITSKQIEVIVSLQLKLIIVSKYLIDIILNNLFSNAIRHNIQGGRIVIYLSGNTLEFQNSGSLKSLKPETIFDRFQKDQKSEGTGLVLTIVQNVCNLYSWDVSYFYRNSLHTFLISFNSVR